MYDTAPDVERFRSVVKASFRTSTFTVSSRPEAPPLLPLPSDPASSASMARNSLEDITGRQMEPLPTLPSEQQPVRSSSLSGPPSTKPRLADRMARSLSLKRGAATRSQKALKVTEKHELSASHLPLPLHSSPAVVAIHATPALHIALPAPKAAAVLGLIPFRKVGHSNASERPGSIATCGSCPPTPTSFRDVASSPPNPEDSALTPAMKLNRTPKATMPTRKRASSISGVRRRSRSLGKGTSPAKEKGKQWTLKRVASVGTLRVRKVQGIQFEMGKIRQKDKEEWKLESDRLRLRMAAVST